MGEEAGGFAPRVRVKDVLEFVGEGAAGELGADTGGQESGKRAGAGVVKAGPELTDQSGAMEAEGRVADVGVAGRMGEEEHGRKQEN
jgi:hypothetical protein